MFVSHKIVRSRNKIFVRKNYFIESFSNSIFLFVLTCLSQTVCDMNAWDMSITKPCRKLINLEVLPNFQCNKSKCQVCVESKYAKHPYKSVERNSNPLELIHTDICDMKSTPTRGGKKYFITFIDDCTRYCYVYLLNGKDEAIETYRQYKTEVENQLDKKIVMIRSGWMWRI